MNNFEMLLNELTSKSKKNTMEKATEKATATAKPQEKREILIRYTPGKEEEPEIVKSSDPKEDSYVLSWAIGKMLEESTGIDADEVSSAVIKTMIKTMLGKVMEAMLE